MEINICLVHRVDGVGGNVKQIQHIAVMKTSVRYMDEDRYTATQINQGMHLDGPFAVFAHCPAHEIDTA